MSNQLRIMGKTIDIGASTVLYDEPFTEGNLEKNWNIYSGEWRVQDGWLTGKNPESNPGMIISKADFPGNVLMDFQGRTVLPSTHDIDFMWNGSWDEDKNCRGFGYVVGIQGWWEGKIGLEKSPEYRLTAATQLYDFRPGEIYHIQAGSIDGHCFIFINNKLAIEVFDSEPIDSQKYAKVGFEAFCSHIQIRHLKIRRINWSENPISYKPEF